MSASRQVTLSIIFPVLDAVEDIEGVFTTVANQINIDKKSIEIIVVNDGSTDNTLQEVDRCAELFKGFAKFTVFSHSKRMGLAQTRLDGAKKALGTFITFIDKRARPDPDYITNLLSKKRNIVIGDVYMDKTASVWDRFFAIIKYRLYFPYFNHAFDDIELDNKAYKTFINKGGGGVMLVLRSYYLDIAKRQSMSMHVNDDSWFMESLTKREPLLKTASARVRYLNRVGFKENVQHLMGRGPKFVDYYFRPGTRFFRYIVLLILLIITNLIAIVTVPALVLYELASLVVVDLLIAAWLAQEWPKDLIVSLLLLPVAALAFSAGVLKGLTMKLFRRY